ncbi:MAG: hypothetical protein JXA93_21615, partial [Anaerolineae bacterium]|nr:hypothetical protein [Anaerolineae bacterium]
MYNSQLAILNAQFALLGLLLPAGLILLAGGSLAGRRPARSATVGLSGLALAAIAYWAAGFAFHMGGVGLVSTLPGLEGLVWEWASPFNLDWGVLGLRGFLLRDEASTPAAMALYLAYLPSLATAVVIPLLSLRERMPGWMAALGGLTIALLVYPAAANWFSGGGWLMHVGDTLGLGHGYVDLTGLSSAAVVGGVAALLGIFFFGRRLPPLPAGEIAALPPAHLPVLAVVGAVLVIAGGIGIAWANPLLLDAGLATPRAGVNLVLTASAGALVPALYTWFVTGSADSLMVARGAAAGLLACAAGLTLMPAWSAAALGAAAGLLVPLTTFLVAHLLRVDDPTGALPVVLIGGLLGVLAPGFFADGRAGAGWHGIGTESYLGITGQGITGFFPAPGLAPDWPGQINAQLLGLAAIAGLTVAAAGILFLLLRVLLFFWHVAPTPVPEEGQPLDQANASRSSIMPAMTSNPPCQKAGEA